MSRPHVTWHSMCKRYAQNHRCRCGIQRVRNDHACTFSGVVKIETLMETYCWFSSQPMLMITVLCEEVAHEGHPVGLPRKVKMKCCIRDRLMG
jgi:hypothetical protein